MWGRYMIVKSQMESRFRIQIRKCRRLSVSKSLEVVFNIPRILHIHHEVEIVMWHI